MVRILLLLLVVVVGVWLVATVGPWQHSSVAAFALLGLCGVALMAVARLLRRRGPTADPAEAQRAARFAVTRMLATLTRMQVAYLSQGFSSEAEGRAWLRHAMPRSFRGALEDLVGDLELARGGAAPESLSLPLRVIELRRQLEAREAALEQLAARYPGHALARPLVFVVTEMVSPEGEADPLVISVAGWDPSKPALIPVVDALTVYAGEGLARRVLGQVDFGRVERALRPHLQAEEQPDGQRILVCAGVPLAELPLPLAEIPLGFLVADAED